MFSMRMLKTDMHSWEGLTTVEEFSQLSSKASDQRVLTKFFNVSNNYVCKLCGISGHKISKYEKEINLNDIKMLCPRCNRRLTISEQL